MRLRERFRSLEVRAMIVVAVVMAIAAVWRSGTAPEEDVSFPRPSTFRSAQQGARALYLAAERLGIPVGRWMSPLSEEDGFGEIGPAALAILMPEEPVTAPEAERILRWIQEGGRLLYAPGFFDASLLQELRLEDRFRRKGPWGDLPIVPDTKGSTARKALRSTSGDPALREAVDVLEGCPETIEGLPGRFLVGPGCPWSPVALYSEGDRAAAMFLRIGRGRALVLSSAAPLVNGSIRKSGAAVLALRALARFSRGGAVFFDEFHHGFDNRGGIERALWRFLSRTPAGWAILLAAAIALVALISGGVRLGSPVGPPPRPRRSSLEHVRALASGYLAARATARPARFLAEGLRLRLGARDREDLQERLRSLAAERPALRGDAQRVLGALGKEPVRAAPDLTGLSRSIDRIIAACAGAAPKASNETTMEETRAGRK